MKVLMHHGDKHPKRQAFTSIFRGKICGKGYALIHVKELQSIDWQTIVLDD